MIKVLPGNYAPVSQEGLNFPTTPSADLCFRIVTRGRFGLHPANVAYEDTLVRPWYPAIDQADLEAGSIGDRSGFFVPGHLLGETRGYMDHSEWLFGKEGDEN